MRDGKDFDMDFMVASSDQIVNLGPGQPALTLLQKGQGWMDLRDWLTLSHPQMAL
jgi:hypothetical protein